LSSDLPLAVRAFAVEHIDSPDEIDVLAAVVDFADRWWDAEMIRKQCGMTTDRARAILDRLAAHNLLDIRVTGAVRYQFRPAAPELESAARVFVDAYRRDPVSVITAILGRAQGRGARDFANAFRIRRDDSS
jgi:hypothetical protein